MDRRRHSRRSDLRSAPPRHQRTIAAHDRIHLLACAALAVAGFVVLVARRPDVVSPAKLWAEDGAIFMRDAYVHHGYQTLLAPYNGTVLVVPRIWALVTALLPVHLLPLSYALFSLVADVAALSVVLSRRFAWLVPSLAVRAILFLALVLLPGTWEIYGNLTNSIWYFGACLLLLSFAADPASRLGSATEIAVAALLVLSGAAGIVVSPLFALRWWRTRSRHSAVVTAVVGAGAAFQLVELRTHPRTPAQLSSVGPWGFTRTMVERVGGTAALGQYRLGRWWPSRYTHHHAAALLLASVLLAAVVVLAVFFVPRAIGVQLAVAMVLQLAAATLGVVGSFRQLNDPQFSGRYFVGPVALLFVTLAIAVPAALVRMPARWSWLALLPVAVVTFGVIGDARLHPQPSIGWTVSASCIARHRACHVPLDPPGWSVDLPPVRAAY